MERRDPDRPIMKAPMEINKTLIWAARRLILLGYETLGAVRRTMPGRMMPKIATLITLRRNHKASA
jgi:hypothetical protein